LAKHYNSLTPEERFRLILAASGRGDEAERDRLGRSGGRIALSISDHAPYALAFEEMSRSTYLELLEDAARYFDACALLDDGCDHLGGSGEDGDPVKEKEGVSAEREADAESAVEDRSDQSTWQRYLGIVRVFGFILRSRAEGWKRFCERLSVPPFFPWQELPGFDRLQRALSLAERNAFDPEGVLRWMNTKRPAGTPARVEISLTAEGVADATEKLFRERAQWWGG
jgi:hypothetical protein